MASSSIAAKTRYWLDGVLTRYPRFRFVLLVVFALAVVLVGGILYIIAGLIVGDGFIFRDHPIHGFWHAILRLFDPGTMALDTTPGTYDVVWPVTVRIVSVIIAIGGLSLLGLTIGTITSSIDSRIEELKKGKGPIFENGHHIIIGWSTKIFTIIEQLIASNDFNYPMTICILSEKEKPAMDDEIRGRFKLPKWLKMVTRSGNATDLEALSWLSLDTAASITVIQDETTSENILNSDSRIIKTLLAICYDPKVEYRKDLPIVAELSDGKLKETTQLASKKRANVLVKTDLIAKLMVQTARTTGLPDVYAELLCFTGSELYIHDATPLKGLTFGEAIFAFDKQIPVGIVSKDPTKPTRINPSKDRKIIEGDSLVLLSETERIEETLPPRKVEVKLDVKPVTQPSRGREKILILGFSRELPYILKEFNTYAHSGADVLLVNKHEKEDLPPLDVYENLKVDTKKADWTLRSTLESLKPGEFDAIILLSDETESSIETADAQVIIALLLIRDIIKSSPRADNIKLVSKILEVRNKKLTSIAQANDTIISNEIISMVLTQLALDPRLMVIYEDLFSEKGSEIYLKPPYVYGIENKSVSFREVIAASLKRDEIAFGYRLSRGDIYLNPPLDESIQLGPKDEVIVMAENEGF